MRYVGIDIASEKHFVALVVTATGGDEPLLVLSDRRPVDSAAPQTAVCPQG
jgi:hypothetical protein